MRFITKIRKRRAKGDDLVAANEAIVGSCVREVMKWSKDAIFIVVANPLDAMCEVARRITGWPRERVFGMAGILDTARMRAFIAMELDCATEDVRAFVLGGHGDTMVPLVRYTSVAGIPLTTLLPQERIDAIVERTRKGGGEIVSLLKTGSAYYAPAAGAAEMVLSKSGTGRRGCLIWPERWNRPSADSSADSRQRT